MRVPIFTDLVCRYSIQQQVLLCTHTRYVNSVVEFVNNLMLCAPNVR